MLQKAGIPAAPVSSPGEVMRSPQLETRNFFISRDHPGGGKIAMPSIPYRFSQCEYEKPFPAPGLGEHNQKIYSRLVFNDNAIETLRRDGII